MLTFWILASLLVLLAFAFVLPPLLKTTPTTPIADVDREAVNIAIYQERLADLQQQGLSEAQFAQAKAELDKTLLQDVAKPNEANTGQDNARWVSVAVAAIFIPVVAIGMYWQYGASALLDREMTSPSPAASTSAETGMASASGMAGSLQDSAQQLADKLAQNPDDVEGWVMLARTYSQLDQPQKAADAYSKAVALTPQNADILAEFAEALTSANQGRMSGQPEILVKAALEIDPNNQRALFFAGVAAMQKQDFASAVQYWQRLLPLVPEDRPEIRQVLEQQIQRAQILADAGDVPAEATQPTTETIAATAASLQVSVSLDPSINDQVKPTDTVFIYARAASGPPMPIAITRVTVAQLPITVTLDDSSAMMPNRRLSQFDSVSVLARVSPSGQAMPQAGDWLGQLDNVQTATQEPININIDHAYGEAAPVKPDISPAAVENTPVTPNAEASTDATASDKTGVQLQVQVSLSQALQAETQPEDTVFIFAKAVNGPPMPLAIVRKTVADLPLTVTLSEDMAMMPDLSLASFPQITVVARVSKAGDAMPKSGDLQGVSEPVEVKTQSAVSVEIDQKIP